MSPGPAAEWPLLLCCAALFAGSCAAQERGRPAELGLGSPAPSTPLARPAVDEPSPDATAATEPVLLLDDPLLLAGLEHAGLAFADFIVAPGTGVVSNRTLTASPRYRALSRVLSADLEDLARGDAAAGVGVARFSHRLFDRRWLEDDAVRFELVAIVNRADRSPFRAGSCGETRLVYRLAYRRLQGAEEVQSRLPMTVSLELAHSEHCSPQSFARSWQAPSGLSGIELGEWLQRGDGPLSAARLARALPTQRLSVNLQGVRWPSTVRPDLGGHAEYLLRVFELDATQSYVAAPLENTPDRQRLERDPRQRAALLAWIRDPDNLAAVDAGTALVPRQFAATRALSVTPRGLSRLANRPFSALYSVDEVNDLDFSRTRFVRSGSGLLRRLDQLSCSGCHAARSVAGFHFLGDEPPDAIVANALAAGASPHLVLDLPRRGTISRALASAGVADFSQPFAERAGFDGYGAHCGFGSDPTFSGWTCAEGLECRPYDGAPGEHVGQCLPLVAGRAGDACETGPLRLEDDPRRDRILRVERTPCGQGAVCNGNAVGFPGGMCAESCSALSRGAACGAIAVLEPFNACLARSEPFARCLSLHVRPAGLRLCDASSPCRDDYVCARSGGEGVCIPPYFLFQLRVDGHR